MYGGGGGATLGGTIFTGTNSKIQDCPGDCILELLLEEGQTIRKKNKKRQSIQVTNKDFQPEHCKWARIEDNLFFCTVTDKCSIFTTQHTVISSKA